MRDGDEVVCLGVTWTIKMDHETDLELASDDEWASTDSVLKIIRIRQDVQDMNVVMHELVHVMEHGLLMDTDEEEVHMRAIALRDLLRNNPKLIEEVCE